MYVYINPKLFTSFPLQYFILVLHNWFSIWYFWMLPLFSSHVLDVGGGPWRAQRSRGRDFRVQVSKSEVVVMSCCWLWSWGRGCSHATECGWKELRVSRQSNSSTVALGEADHDRMFASPDPGTRQLHPRRFHQKVPCFVGTKTLWASSRTEAW